MHLYIVKSSGNDHHCRFYQEALRVQAQHANSVITDHFGAALLPGRRNPLVEQLAAWLDDHTRIRTNCHEVANKLVVFLAQNHWQLPELGEDTPYIACTMLSGWLTSRLANKDTSMADIAESLCQTLTANDWKIPKSQATA